jgi:RNA 3'-terminal phosphate cyclase (ATP)
LKVRETLYSRSISTCAVLIMKESILTIDGSYGEGGGQVLRSSLAMSLFTGRPFVIENIRAGRKKPGLMRQQLTAVHAATEVIHAEATGATIGSARLEFRPGTITSGNYTFSVGTAGSTTLELQTILPALMLAESESNLTLEGGTHKPFAPPLEFLTKAGDGFVLRCRNLHTSPRSRRMPTSPISFCSPPQI